MSRAGPRQRGTCPVVRTREGRHYRGPLGSSPRDRIGLAQFDLPVNPNTTVAMYLVYLIISVALTVWVARTLHKNGRVFLVDSFLGNEALADSVNHLLVVGFYLINIGFVTLALKYGDKASNAQTALEILSTKVGMVLVVLGFMHLLNLYIFNKIRKRALLHTLPPPVPGDGYIALP